MIAVVVVTFINLFSIVFTFLLLARVLMSWIYPNPGANVFTRIIYELTEPMLAPLRRILPPLGFIDLAPLAAFFLLQGLVWVGHYLILH